MSNIVHALLDKRQLTLTYLLLSVTVFIARDREINDLDTERFPHSSIFHYEHKFCFADISLYNSFTSNE